MGQSSKVITRGTLAVSACPRPSRRRQVNSTANLSSTLSGDTLDKTPRLSSMTAGPHGRLDAIPPALAYLVLAQEMAMQIKSSTPSFKPLNQASPGA
jgi:hypothetical protein